METNLTPEEAMDTRKVELEKITWKVGYSDVGRFIIAEKYADWKYAHELSEKDKEIDKKTKQCEVLSSSLQLEHLENVRLSKELDSLKSTINAIRSVCDEGNSSHELIIELIDNE